MATVALGLTVLFHLGRAWDWNHAAWSLLLCSLLLWRREDFRAASDASSSRWGLLIGGGALAALLIYSYSTVWHYAPEAHLRRDPVVIARASAGLVLFQNLAAEGHHSRHARRSFDGVQLGSLVVILATLALVLRPVLGRRVNRKEEDGKRVEDLIAKHGRDPMDLFALLPDKCWFFHPVSEGVECVIAYALWQNYAVALAEPIGPGEHRAAAMTAFREYCHDQDWHPAFYCCHESNRSAWEDGGWKALHIAEDARLHLASFELKGSAFQNLRTGLNHARKDGWSFRWYEGAPFDHGLEAQMKLVSDGWLASKGGSEMSFDLGAFSLREIRDRGAACVLDKEGRLLAFGTWLPYDYRGFSGTAEGRVIDLMRTSEGARGAMDFLILESIALFKQQGVSEISLGNAPLAHVIGEGEKTVPADRVVEYLFEHFNQVYGYKPLFEFKKKYHPDWQGRYLVFESHTHLPSLAAALVRLHAPKGLLQMLLS
jgi:lysylphosphatidylglycerol synthetase-like protein (DUF2156 family)